ncbi:MAG: TldD/PmbA family protein [Clostridia bacterium]|nr:TldD/PmbA family protein [Clostridia bacterium]
MLQESVVRRVLEEALQTGGDFSELFVEDSEHNSVRMLDGAVENATYSRSRGAGVRVFKGTRSVYATTADTSEEALLRTARAAAAALDGAPEGRVSAFQAIRYAIPAATPLTEMENAGRAAFLRRAHQAAKSTSDEITQIIARVRDECQRVLVCNSEGVWAEDVRPRVHFIVQAVAMNGAEAQTGFSSRGFLGGYERLDTLDVEAEARRAAQSAATMLHAPECPAGYMPVVIDSGNGGVIFHEACGHSLEATSVAKGNSEFCGKLGQRIAASCVTALDDGMLPGEWGSLRVDDEGTPSGRRVLIENGILRSYMIDRLGSRMMNLPVTGNARRESYEYAPTSRMTNTFIAPGTDDEEEMIRTMGDGLFAKSLGGGSVNPLTGEFNFAVDEGYLVRDGKIQTPVRGATLVGKGSEILMQIDRVGTKLALDSSGQCGSISGWVPVDVGQPRIRVKGLTVGGKGGAL